MNDHEPCDCPFCCFVMPCTLTVRIMIASAPEEPQRWRRSDSGRLIPYWVEPEDDPDRCYVCAAKIDPEGFYCWTGPERQEIRLYCCLEHMEQDEAKYKK